MAQSQDQKDIWGCQEHSEDVSELFDEVRAPKAECSGCKPVLELPELGPVQLIRFGRKTCQKEDVSKRFDLAPSDCVEIPKPGSTEGNVAYHWGYQLPKAEGEVSCKRSTHSSFKGGHEKTTFFRGCVASRPGQCDKEDQVCAVSGAGPTCVYRLGEHECPEGYLASRQVLYSGVEDTRSCGTCETVFENGEVVPQGRIELFDNSSCEPFHLKKELKFEDLERECKSDVDLREDRWLYARSRPRKTKFTGLCQTTAWEAQGDVKPKGPVTLCCRALEAG